LIFGPAATTWYGVLTKYVNTSSKNGTIIARVACDQFLFAPVNMGTSPSLSRLERYCAGVRICVLIDIQASSSPQWPTSKAHRPSNASKTPTSPALPRTL
jgi:hypothetical protein